MKKYKINEDVRLIVEQYNQLIAKGYNEAAGLLIKHVQVGNLPSAAPTENVNNATPANNQQTAPMTDKDNPGSASLDLSAVPPEIEIEEDEESPEDEFLENMSGGLYTDLDNQQSSDKEEILLALDDESEEDELETLASDPEAMITIIAQEVPISPQLPLPNQDSPTPDSAPASTSPNIENSPKEESALEISTDSRDIDDLLDKAFGDVTPEMVIKKLEEISKIFKTKEIPRQLALVDFMLDKLGFASFFPALSEASGKAIESSNYIASRIDNVLSSLRGVMQTDDIDLVNGEGSTDPKLQAMQAKLQQQQDKEEARKAAQKEREDKETPVIDIEQPAPAAVTPSPAPVAQPAAPNPTVV